MRHSPGSKRLRRWSALLLGIAVCSGPFISPLALAGAPATQAATKPALSSDFCTISDYCTVILAPKVLDVLGATDAQRATFAKERDRFVLMMSGQTAAGLAAAAAPLRCCWARHEAVAGSGRPE